MKWLLAALCGLTPILLAQMIPSGTLSNITTSGKGANLYIASDGGPCSSIYVKQPSGSWMELFSLGGSGALTCSGNQLDINTAVLPTLAGDDNFTGKVSLAQVHLNAMSGTRPACSQSNRGDIRFENAGTGKDRILACVSSGKGLTWADLYKP
jgi:hypothetical protein